MQKVRNDEANALAGTRRSKTHQMLPPRHAEKTSLPCSENNSGIAEEARFPDIPAMTPIWRPLIRTTSEFRFRRMVQFHDERQKR